MSRGAFPSQNALGSTKETKEREREREKTHSHTEKLCLWSLVSGLSLSLGGETKESVVAGSLRGESRRLLFTSRENASEFEGFGSNTARRLTRETVRFFRGAAPRIAFVLGGGSEG
jgi:hypothetical protein